ncbi:MAG: deoxyuridine 5'-triphosphate nucleotidohydrolase [Chloroflexota bacterium]|jgi:dUTP pyrophosphatase|nr:deoxyuridine 5'-triphosphate nucleotidohydrolase [Chloroflexota bacterium]
MQATGGVLSREELIARITDGERPLLTHMPSFADQVQPNGVDLTLSGVHRHTGLGSIARDNSGRVLPELVELQPEEGWFHLTPGPWHITYNEIVDLPDNLMALGRPRSSLGRSGVTIHTAVWDAGYRGRSTSLLQVLNPAGFVVELNARVMQLVFFSLNTATVEGYSGKYQDENIER